MQCDILHLGQGKETRNILHFHYLIWPDHGVPPTTSLIDFTRRCFSEQADGPVVVHCSAGILSFLSLSICLSVYLSPFLCLPCSLPDISSKLSLSLTHTYILYPGVGRTGTLIALHLQMRMLEDEQLVNIYGIVCQLRKCRKLMVQTVVCLLCMTLAQHWLITSANTVFTLGQRALICCF